MDASADAFVLLDQIVAARLRRGLTALVDTLGLDSARRLSYLELARSSSMPAVAVLVDTDPVKCRRRNRARDRPVPAPVLEGRMRAAAVEIRGVGWDLVTTANQAQPEASDPDRPRGRPLPHLACRRLRLSTAHSRQAPGSPSLRP